ncbi:MAG TPA: PspC domain-containing protein [Plantibacter sp.]|uniref:PspC domain-containing protein n=1 Tax=unclassified Plantibacter TaxID=2624265 RepID=UPI002B9F0DBF|nr:PspC domain-containing protein [Plantibacter sp.]
MTNHSTPPAGPPQGPPTQQDGATRFFDWWRSMGLRRSSESWLGGVAGGVAERLGIDPVIVRGVAIVIAILGGPILFLYAAAWALVPDQQGRIHLERAIRGVFDPAMVAIGVMAVLTVVPFMRGLWWDGVPGAWNLPGWLESTMTAGWVIALIAATVWLIIMFARRGQTQAAPPAPTTPRHDPWTSAAATPGPHSSPPVPWHAQGTEAAPAPSAWTSAPTTPGGAPASNDAPTRAGTDMPTTPLPTTPLQAAPLSAAPAAADWPGAPTAQRGWTSQEFRDEMDRQRAEQREQRESAARERRVTKPGAAFVAIALGLALLAGAGSAVFAAGTGAVSATIIVVGTATALGTLAIATIVAGISGRESGWLGFFTFVAVIGLLVAGVFPAGSTFSFVGRTTWNVSSAPSGEQQGYVMIAGQPTLDLRDLDDVGASRGGTIDVWLVAGELDVILPEDTPVVVEVAAIVGGIDEDSDDRDRDDRRGGGPFYQDEARYGRTASPDTTTVRLWAVAGNTVITEQQEAGR